MTTGESKPETTVVLDADTIRDCLTRLARDIVADNADLESVVLLGILSRGRPLADRLSTCIGQMTGYTPRVGSLATTLYRDDLRASKRPFIGSNVTHFDFDVDGATVILVDDVLSTGRTVRAALDEIVDYGRPARVRLACLIDRGLRELPIQADYLAWSLATRPEDHVTVRLDEVDNEDVVLLETAPLAEENA